MKISTLASVLWAGTLIGHLLLLAVLVVRRRWHDFPVFTSLLVFEALRTVALYAALLYGKHAYFWMYWITGFADYLFQVALIVEIAIDVLRPTGRWIMEARRGFVTWGCVGVLVAAVTALLMGAPQSKGLDLWDARVTVFTSVLTCGLFAAMTTAADRLGLQRRSYVIALGQGLTAWALSALIGDVLHVIFGWGREFGWLVYVVEFIYLGVLVYWMVAFWRPERQRDPLSDEMNAYLLALHQRVQYDLESRNRSNR